MIIHCISLKQPWASAVFDLRKDIENRTWTTSYRGKLYIHASQNYDKYGELWIKDRFNVHFERKSLPTKLILGSVELVDIGNHKLKSPWAMEGQYHWFIKNPILLENPVEVKGSLGIWQLEIESIT